MSFFIPGDTVVANVRSLAQSALPDAPVQPDEPRPPRRLAGWLRSLSRRMLGTTRTSHPSPATRIGTVPSE